MASIKEVNKSIMYYSLYVIVFKFLGLYVLNRFFVQFSEMEIIFQISYDIDDLVCVINLRMRSLLDISFMVYHIIMQS